MAHGEFELYLATTRLERWWSEPREPLLAQAEQQLARAGGALDRAGLAAARGDAAILRALAAERPEPWLDAAVASYTTAIEARPTWPRTWASRAVARARLGDGPGFRNDLARALALGPNTGSTLLILARHAGAVAPRLDPAGRAALAALGARQARARGPAVTSLVARLGLLVPWCEALAADSDAPALCADVRQVLGDA